MLLVNLIWETGLYLWYEPDIWMRQQSAAPSSFAPALHIPAHTFWKKTPIFITASWARLSVRHPHYKEIWETLTYWFHVLGFLSSLASPGQVAYGWFCFTVCFYRMCVRRAFFTGLIASGPSEGSVGSPLITRKDRCFSTRRVACIHFSSHTHIHWWRRNITYSTYESYEVTPKSVFMWKALIHFPPLKNPLHFTASPSIEHDSPKYLLKVLQLHGQMTPSVSVRFYSNVIEISSVILESRYGFGIASLSFPLVQILSGQL